MLLCLSVTGHAQSICAGVGVSGLLQTEKDAAYPVFGGMDAGIMIRLHPRKWIYAQLGYSMGALSTSETQVSSYRINTLDWRFGIVPFQKIPVHFFWGGERHKYIIKTKSFENGGFTILPATTREHVMNAMQFGVGYPVLKWLEVNTRYAREPFNNRDPHPYMLSYLRIEVVFNLDK